MNYPQTAIQVLSGPGVKETYKGSNKCHKG